MKVNFYAIFERAIIEGVTRGYRRAHKHLDNPDEVSIVDNIHREIMNELCEYFDFNDAD